MTTKRPGSPILIPNPFIKKRNLEWTLETSDIESTQSHTQNTTDGNHNHASPPTNAAIEAGQASITDHLQHFSTTLSSHILSSCRPLLSIPSYRTLYKTNAHSHKGAHFVIHQHDHPVAGTHYDLRLQINETSSASWAIMYGLPGDPNSVRLNRNATETRVHCLWNHLVETGSESTGSLIIWDTGTYEVLKRRSKYAPKVDPDSQGSASSSDEGVAGKTQQERLHEAFHNRKIRLRLHGSKLPERYVLNLRLTKSEDAQGRARSGRRPRFRRKGVGTRMKKKAEEIETDSGSDRGDDKKGAQIVDDDDDVDDVVKTGDTGPEATSAMERELRELEDEHVRRTNAYPGAANTIASVHQRKWYLSLDRTACGFTKRGKRWVAAEDLIPGEKDAKIVGAEEDAKPTTIEGTDVDGENAVLLAGKVEHEGRLTFPFYVHGSEKERSAVTGRLGRDVLRDEGVEGFVQRKGWKAVLN